MFDRSDTASVTFNSTLLRLIDQACAAIDRCPRTAGDHLREARRLLDHLDREDEDSRAVLSKGGLASWQVNRIRGFIESHLADPLSGLELANVVRLSPGHFARAFKASFGVSPHAYVRERRVAVAQDLMLTTNRTLAEISGDCGFSDQSHLCHMFRRSVGLSPAAWRRRQMTLNTTSRPVASARSPSPGQMVMTA